MVSAPRSAPSSRRMNGEGCSACSAGLVQRRGVELAFDVPGRIADGLFDCLGKGRSHVVMLAVIRVHGGNCLSVRPQDSINVP